MYCLHNLGQFRFRPVFCSEKAVQPHVEIQFPRFIDKCFQQAPLSREVARRYVVTVMTEQEAPIKQVSFFIKCEFWQASI